MSLSLCILASGSSGNCTAIHTPGGLLLVDCGIGPRIASARLQGAGAKLSDVSAICLTHLDYDHFKPAWLRTILARGIRVFCHRSMQDELLHRVDNDSTFASLLNPFDEDFTPLPGLSVQSIALAHDVSGSNGFVIEGFDRRIGYATDLGRVTRELIDRFCGLDILAIESNYDPQMQRRSGRPWYLQERITGGRGHLSNEQAFAAVRQVLDRCQTMGRRLPRHIVLLHRSRQCNCPSIVRDLFSGDQRIEPRLVLAEQDTRTDWLRLHERAPLTGEQLAMAWG